MDPHPNPVPEGRGDVKLSPLRPRSGGERGDVKLSPLRRRRRGERAKTPSADTVAAEGKVAALPAPTQWRR